MADDYEQYEKALIRLRAKAYPYALLKANNLLGTKMWNNWKLEYRRTMTLRNTWTIRSLKLVKSRRPVIKSMRVIVGTRLQYLELNEHGGTAKPKESRKFGMMNPTNAARRGSSYGGLVPRGTKRKSIGSKRSGAGKKQRNAIQMAQAKRNRQKLALIEFDNGEVGFYKAKGRGRKTNMQLLWSTKDSQKITKNNTMERAYKKTVPHMPKFMTVTLKREIAEVKRRYGI